MQPLMITGISGFLGSYAGEQLAQTWQVHGTYCTQPVQLHNAVVHHLDLQDEIALQRCWDRIQPRAVLHTAAMSKVHQCEQDPDKSYQVNVVSAVALARRCATAGIPFLFTSTDLVFDGTQPPYGEGDRPSPVNIYGTQKAAAEREILAVYPQATVCRLPLLYGAATPTATCFLQGFLAAMAAGQPLTLFTDEVRTPVAVTDAVRGLQLVLDQGRTGIVHLGGPQRLNRYEFGLLMAEAFHVSATCLRPCLQADVDLPAPRPKDVSLNSEQAFAWGYAPRLAEVALKEIAALG